MIIIDPNNNSDIIKSLKPHALRDQLKLQYSWSVTLLTLPLPACRAGSIKRYRCASVRLSVCLSQHGPTAASLHTSCCRFAAVGSTGRRYRSIAAAWRRANAGSGTLSAYVGG